MKILSFGNALSGSLIFSLLLVYFVVSANGQSKRLLTGTVATPQFEFIPGAAIEIETAAGVITVVSNSEGSFSAEVPDGDLKITVKGKNLRSKPLTLSAGSSTNNIRLEAVYVVAPINESVTITDESPAPDIERRNDTIYKNSLFGRDDQIIFTLNAGINAGQHEGGGKSLEIRRFGFNTDHGGVNGGVKIMVDNIPQNQGTQGHGQGYLGDLKSLTPELVKDVSIINGPFSAAYGDFSGLGVVQIQLKESLPDQFTARIQGGAHNTIRGFFAYSPSWKNYDAFIAYEPSYTDGPFIEPLKYRRDNVTGNIAHKIGEDKTLGFKFNFGRNNFYSSGQIPLDEVYAGRLDRFGFIDPENGGRVRLGTATGYFQKSWDDGTIFKADAFISRSLFDLFSNFTFFLVDEEYGDEIQQHDSRLQQGANVQILKPYGDGKTTGLITAGGGFHLNQVNVGLYPTISRNPYRKFLPENIDNADVLLTKANANIKNFSGYIQNTTNFFNGHLRLNTGLRFDHFGYKLNGYELGGIGSEECGNDLTQNSGGTKTSSEKLCVSASQRLVLGMPCNSDFQNPVDPANPCALLLNGSEGAGKLQPKLGLAWSPDDRVPVSIYANYGRGISSQDARGVIRSPNAPKISTTDFYQVGTSFNDRRFSLVFSAFLIDRSNEQVYIPDDGSIEFAGRSRSYGIELRNSVRLARWLSFNGGLTQVIKAFYPGEFTDEGQRVIVDSAPHTVANASLVFTELRGFNFSFNWRHISSYRLDGEDPSIKAAGHDVVDFSLSKRLTKWMDVNFAIDNLFNKKYYETQNYFESRITPGTDVISRIHATPGYPFSVYAGVTFRIGAKN